MPVKLDLMFPLQNTKNDVYAKVIKNCGRSRFIVQTIRNKVQHKAMLSEWMLGRAVNMGDLVLLRMRDNKKKPVLIYLYNTWEKKHLVEYLIKTDEDDSTNDEIVETNEFLDLLVEWRKNVNLDKYNDDSVSEYSSSSNDEI